MKLKQGDVVYIWWLGLPIRHYGIVVDEGFGFREPLIRTVFPGCMAPQTQTLSQFTGGNHAKLRRREISSKVSGYEAAMRAMSMTHFDYSLVTNNCEYFFKRCYGLPEFSEQVAIYGIALPLIAAMASGGRLKVTA